MALQHPQQIIESFREGLALHDIRPPNIAHRLFCAGAQHVAAQRGLPAGKHLIYIFSLGETFGTTCPAGTNKVLRVGKATTNGRLTQNYIQYPTTPALATKLATQKLFWPYLGLTTVGPTLISWDDWIQGNTDRDQLEVPSGNVEVLNLLEKYVRGRAGPVFEG